MFLYELITLSQPYSDLTPAQVKQLTVEGKRPPLTAKVGAEGTMNNTLEIPFMLNWFLSFIFVFFSFLIFSQRTNELQYLLLSWCHGVGQLIRTTVLRVAKCTIFLWAQSFQDLWTCWRLTSYSIFPRPSPLGHVITQVWTRHPRH